MKQNIFVILVCLCLPRMLPAADWLAVRPVTDRLLVLDFDEGHIDYFGLHQDRFNGNRIYSSLLDVAAAADAHNYLISSVDDNRFASGLYPTALGRKAKGEEFNNIYEPAEPQHLKHHWIYLELPFAMQVGKSYTIQLYDLAANVNRRVFVFDETKQLSPTLHVNQIGFTPRALKFAYLSHFMGSFNTTEHAGGALNLDRWAGAAFHLRRLSDDSTVYSGVIALQQRKTAVDFAGAGFKNANMTRADVWECDFSDFDVPGEYYVSVDRIGRSHPFEINADIYRSAYYYASRALFTQRQGVIREIEPGLDYPRGHRTEDGCEMKYYPTLQGEGDFQGKLSRGNVTGVWGWYHDAGDWDCTPNHYVVPMTLLALYDLKPENFGDGDVGMRYKHQSADAWIDEGRNGIPDVLDEAMWLIRYYKRAKDALIRHGYTTGGVPGYAGVDAGADGGKPSWEDKRPLALKGADSVAMSYRYAACAAYLALCLDKFHGSVHPDAGGWVDEARATYTWAQRQNRDANADVNRARMMAAAALYRYTADAGYQNDFKNCKAKDNEWKSGLWFTVNPWHHAAVIFGNIADNHPGLDKSLKQQCISDLVTMANSEIVQTAKGRGFRYGSPSNINFMLGSLSAPRVFAAAAAFSFTGQPNLLDACLTTCDYCLGGNQLDLVKVAGLGENYERQPFHPDSWYLIDYNSMVYTNPILPGYVIYEMHQTGDWMMGANWNWIGDEDYSRSTAFPAIHSFPDAEARFFNRLSIAGSEFTVHQTQIMAVFAYGYLCDRYRSAFTPNRRPDVSLRLADNSAVKKDSVLVLRVDASTDVRRVEYYYDWHFIGESTDVRNNFVLYWNLADYKIAAGKRLITAKAYDDQGMESKPTDNGDRIIQVVLSTDVKESRLHRFNFELKNCFPNPANPVSRIEFSLPVQGQTRLEIFNVLGEKVDTLLDRGLDAGVHNVSFRTSQWASGVYYCKLQQDTQLDVKKFLVLK